MIRRIVLAMLFVMVCALTVLGDTLHMKDGSYGLGYSDLRVRKFFKKQADKLKDAHIEDAKDDGPVLGSEDLAAKMTPITVCIFICRGTPPSAGSDGGVKAPK